MIDLSSPVANALEAICSNVFFYYPDDFETLPAISYFDNGNSSNDNSDLLTKVSFQIDVWSLTVPDCKTITAAADTAMRGLGFRRTFSQPIPDPSGYRHQSMKYQGTFNAIDGNLYSR
jgi:hypothetical protein